MRVGELVRKKHTAVITIQPAASVAVAVRLLIEEHVGGLAVVDAAERLVGFVSERDVVESLLRHPGDVRQLPVAQIMRRPPTCELDHTLREVMERMTRERLRHLVAVHGERAVGIVSVGDIVKHRLEELELETGVLRDYVAARRAT